jgi:hypothetical protein
MQGATFRVRRAGISLEAFDGIRQNREHQFFFRDRMRLLPKNVEVLILGDSVGFV